MKVTKSSDDILFIDSTIGDYAGYLFMFILYFLVSCLLLSLFLESIWIVILLSIFIGVLVSEILHRNTPKYIYVQDNIIKCVFFIGRGNKDIRMNKVEEVCFLCGPFARNHPLIRIVYLSGENNNSNKLVFRCPSISDIIGILSFFDKNGIASGIKADSSNYLGIKQLYRSIP